MEAASVIAWMPLGELLVERGLVSQQELDDALAHQVESGELLGAILVARGDVSSAALTAVLAEQAGVPWKPLGQLLVERGLLTRTELDDALSHQVETGERLGEILVRRRIVAGAVLTAILAEQEGVELEMEPGFGSGLFAKLSTREEPSGRSPAPSLRHHLHAPASGGTASPTRPDDPAFELIRLRSELELAHARVAELEHELATLRGGKSSSRRAIAR